LTLFVGEFFSFSIELNWSAFKNGRDVSTIFVMKTTFHGDRPCPFSLTLFKHPSHPTVANQGHALLSQKRQGQNHQEASNGTPLRQATAPLGRANTVEGHRRFEWLEQSGHPERGIYAAGIGQQECGSTERGCPHPREHRIQ
jgi:hypothetical protein